MSELIKKTSVGFKTLSLDQKYKDKALKFIRKWLEDPQFEEYSPQIKHLINSEDWDYLLDCFYQIIPFGTGGRRGEVGIGPNRINKWTIQASAQGHAQFLLKQYKDEAKKRGVVLSYGVREFFSNSHFSNDLQNPVRNLTGKNLAYSAAQVYAANGIFVQIFDSPRTTPELSYAIRHLHAVAGDMFDASHNPPEHNGKKVYDEFGGQLIPPYDENLVTEVTKNVKEIKIVDLKVAESKKLFKVISSEVDDSYINEIKKLSLSSDRSVKIAFTPLHGVASTSVLEVLKELSFDVNVDPKTSNQSGKFENVTFNIPNPEVIQSFDTTKKYASKIGAEIILNADPDADRIGVMVKHNEKWRFLNGNEIGAILLNFLVAKKLPTLQGKGIVIKTAVTTNLATKICEANGIEIIGDLLVGFKYIGEVMNQLEANGRIDNFLIGLEESHGYIAGNYLRDKDAAIAGLWLAELASDLKNNGKTILDFLNDTYSKYGYFRNYLTEIRLPGAEGMTQIQKIQSEMRNNKPNNFGRFEVSKFDDYLERKPIVSETDRASKNVLVFNIKPFDNISTAKVTLRPSGTEPKIKMYFELGTKPCDISELEIIKEKTEETLKIFEKEFMKHCYEILGIDFPERGFLLFWQIPLKDKLKYFEVEKEIIKLKNINKISERNDKLDVLLAFLGSDPLKKVNDAFKKKYNKNIEEYLEL